MVITTSLKPTLGHVLCGDVAGALREREARPGGRRKYVHVGSGPVPYWASPRDELLSRTSRRRFVVWRDSPL